MLIPVAPLGLEPHFVLTSSWERASHCPLTLTALPCEHPKVFRKQHLKASREQALLGNPPRRGSRGVPGRAEGAWLCRRRSGGLSCRSRPGGGAPQRTAGSHNLPCALCGVHLSAGATWQGPPLGGPTSWGAFPTPQLTVEGLVVRPCERPLNTGVSLAAYTCGAPAGVRTDGTPGGQRATQPARSQSSVSRSGYPPGHT